MTEKGALCAIQYIAILSSTINTFVHHCSENEWWISSCRRRSEIRVILNSVWAKCNNWWRSCRSDFPSDPDTNVNRHQPNLVQNSRLKLVWVLSLTYVRNDISVLDSVERNDHDSTPQIELVQGKSEGCKNMLWNNLSEDWKKWHLCLAEDVQFE